MTDHILWDTDQYTHSLQCDEMMKKHEVTDEDLLVLCFIHDLGITWATDVDEEPSNIYCCKKFGENR